MRLRGGVGRTGGEETTTKAGADAPGGVPAQCLIPDAAVGTSATASTSLYTQAVHLPLYLPPLPSTPPPPPAADRRF